MEENSKNKPYQNLAQTSSINHPKSYTIIRNFSSVDVKSENKETVKKTKLNI